MIIPDHFQIKNKLVKGSVFKQKLKANGSKIGSIVQTEIGHGTQYQLINVHKDLIAIVRRVETQNGTAFEIFNEYNKFIGCIERIQTNPQEKTEKIIIRNASNQIVAQTHNLYEIKYEIDLFDNLNIKIGQMRYKNSKLSKSWDVNIFGSFDRRLLIFLPLSIQNKQPGYF